MEQSFGALNLIANVATVLGIVVALYVLINVRRISERLESVLAPKTGIEGFLNMCAQVVECDPDGTCVVGDDGEIVMVNRRMEDISGYHRSELIGKSVELLVPINHKEEHRSYREGFIVSPSSRPMRGLTLRHKRGAEVSVGINLNRYSDSSGSYTIAKVRTSSEEPRASGEWPK